MQKNDSNSAKIPSHVLAARSAALSIEKQFGNKGKIPAIQRFGDKPDVSDEKVISFGVKEVDEASYINGVPQGKIVEIFGPESSGKSWLTLKLMASAQKMNKAVLLFDVEQSFEPEWAKIHGVDVDNLFIMSEVSDDILTAEKVLDYAVAVCRDGNFGLVVIDSTAALIPKAELEGEMSDVNVGLLARAMSKGLRQIINYCGHTGTTIVFINQVREKINVGGGPRGWGDNLTTPGGRALRFYSHQRIKVDAIKPIERTVNGKKETVGRRSKVKFVKNKTARPFGTGEFDINFVAASSPLVRMINTAKNFKLVGMRGGVYKVSKQLSDDGKAIDTGASDDDTLVKFIVDNNLSQKLLDETIRAVEAFRKLGYEDEDNKIDEIIFEMRDNPSMLDPSFSAISENIDVEVKSGNGTSENGTSEDDGEEDEEEFERKFKEEVGKDIELD